MTGAAQAEALLHFWFGTLTDGFADAAHRRRWFSGGAAFDRACRAGFGVLAEQVANGELESWLDEPRCALAYILLTDQLPRNIHRGRPLAFATDAQALNAARQGVSRGLDRSLSIDERCFFYLPFEHSEDRVDQHTSVGLFTDLVAETPEQFESITRNYLRYAEAHREIIKRFGRFPHRNQVLGRGTTPEEAEFLRTSSTFGQ